MFYVRGNNDDGRPLKEEIFRGDGGVDAAIESYRCKHPKAEYVQASNATEFKEWTADDDIE